MTASHLDAAFAIGARLVRDALWDGERCNWIGPGFADFGGAQSLGWGTLGPSLYDGTAGIALFLAELYGRTGELPVGATAAGAIAHAVSQAHALPKAMQLGFYTGSVGTAYAAARTGTLLGRDDLVALGLDLAAEKRSPRGRIQFDMMSGQAGAIPALLAMAQAHGDGRLVDRARAAGEMLLARGKRSARGLSWDSLAERARLTDLSAVPAEIAAQLTARNMPHPIGLSHGAGGIALALLELGVATGDDRFVAAADAGFAYEESWYDEALDGWPDLRRPGAGPGPSAWCHGAAGIAMARVRTFALTGETGRRGAAERALRVAERALRANLPAPAANFSLCHGLAGEAEPFLLWAEATGDAGARALVEAVARLGIERHHGSAAPPWPSGLSGRPDSPGLMLGRAGTGYFYLRAEDSTATPSLLVPGPYSTTRTAGSGVKRAAAAVPPLVASVTTKATSFRPPRSGR